MRAYGFRAEMSRMVTYHRGSYLYLTYPRAIALCDISEIPSSTRNLPTASSAGFCPNFQKESCKIDRFP